MDSANDLRELGDEFVGKRPIPEKFQTVADFEKEELSKLPEYQGRPLSFAILRKTQFYKDNLAKFSQFDGSSETGNDDPV
jgi:hypothetical protein